MRGRKPTPINLKILRGTDRPDRRGKVAQLRTGIPKCPPHLCAEAKAEWQRVSKELAAAGLLTLVDRAALAGYCCSWARLCKAEKEIAVHGAVIVPRMGRPYRSPYLMVANKAMEQMRAFALEFGMTPSSRNRVSGAGAPPAGNGKETFLANPQI